VLATNNNILNHSFFTPLLHNYYTLQTLQCIYRCMICILVIITQR